MMNKGPPRGKWGQ